jgi:polyhydroxyalkanoate synthesis regulator phasin
MEDKMTEQTEKTEKTETAEPKTVRSSLYETTRLVLLAGVGAISLAQEEINIFLDRLVERGEMAEADARKLVREVVERREKLEKEHRQQVVEARRAASPSQAAPATRADIDALTARIADLTRQIEEMRKQQAQ